ncbi:ribonuclease PH, partial [Francisella tularensis subsp. holarctica]|nr:ribonuclease PH [Francisella tularensis subsp. holarctica]
AEGKDFYEEEVAKMHDLAKKCIKEIFAKVF